MRRQTQNRIDPFLQGCGVLCQNLHANITLPTFVGEAQHPGGDFISPEVSESAVTKPELVAAVGRKWPRRGVTGELPGTWLQAENCSLELLLFL